MTVSIYSARFEYLTDERQVRTTTIEYQADSVAEAIRSAHRFWKNRNESDLIGDVFNKLLCLGVGRLIIGNIDDAGFLNTRFAGSFFEYKIDTAGMDLADYVEYRASRYI